MSTRELSGLADRPYDRALLGRELERFAGRLRLAPHRQRMMRKAIGSLLELLEGCAEPTLQERWQAVEAELWPQGSRSRAP